MYRTWFHSHISFSFCVTLQFASHLTPLVSFANILCHLTAVCQTKTHICSKKQLHLVQRRKEKKKSENLLCGNIICCFMTEQNSTISFDTWLRLRLTFFTAISSNSPSHNFAVIFVNFQLLAKYQCQMLMSVSSCRHSLYLWKKNLLELHRANIIRTTALDCA